MRVYFNRMCIKLTKNVKSNTYPKSYGLGKVPAYRDRTICVVELYQPVISGEIDSEELIDNKTKKMNITNNILM